MKSVGNLYSRFDVLRFPLIVLVVFIHNASMDVKFASGGVTINADSPALNFIINFISQGFARIAVPLFYFMSAYLLFYKFEMSRGGYIQKLKHRLHSLFIPFLFWNVVVLAVRALGQSLPQTAPMFNAAKDNVLAYTPWDYVDSIFGLTSAPIAYQFWFIRDLMALVILSPLIYYAIRYIGVYIFLLLVPLWIMDVWPVFFPHVEPTLFFSIGAYFAIKQRNPFFADKQGPALAVVCSILFAISSVWRDTIAGQAAFYTGILGGIPLMLYVSGLIVNRQRMCGLFSWLSTTSFFVFAAHEPLLTVFRKLSFRLIPLTTETAIALYFVLPIVVIVLLIVVYMALGKMLPQFTSLITGGRVQTTPRLSAEQAAAQYSQTGEKGKPLVL